jgi:hypothetical protein
MAYKGAESEVTLQNIDGGLWWAFYNGSDYEKVVAAYDKITLPVATTASAYGKLTKVGDYTVGLRGGSAANFTFDLSNNGKDFNGQKTGMLKVEKAVVYVYTDAYEKYYMGANPALRLRYEGFKNGANPDSPGSVEAFVKPSVEFAVVDADGRYLSPIQSGGFNPAGTGDGNNGYYVVYIGIDNASAAQYTFALKGSGREAFATFTILKGEITGLSMSDRSITYDGSVQTITVKASNTNFIDYVNHIKYRYFPGSKGADGKLTFADDPLTENGKDVVGVSNAGYYLVEAYYEDSDSFAAWSRSAVLTVNRKNLVIVLDKVFAEYGGSAAPFGAVKIINAGELTEEQSAALIATFTYVYTDKDGVRLTDRPVNAGVYKCTVEFAGNGNYSAASSATAETVISPVYIQVKILQKAFIYNGYMHDLNNYKEFYTQSKYDMSNFSEYELVYGYADGTVDDYNVTEPKEINLYTYDFVPNNKNFIFNGDCSGMIAVSPAEISDEGLLATVRALSEDTVLTTVKPNPGKSSGVLSFQTVYSKPTASDDDDAFNKTMINVWDNAKVLLGKKYSVKAISEIVIYKNATTVETSRGNIEITIMAPVSMGGSGVSSGAAVSATGSSFMSAETALFVRRDDGTFKELVYVDNGDGTITFISDTLGYFVFASETIVPIELTVGLSVGGGVLLILIIVAIVLGKRAKRLRLLHKYVEDASSVRTVQRARRRETVDGQTTYTIIRDYDPEIDDETVFYDSTGE